MLSNSEENYLKTLLSISSVKGQNSIGTNELAIQLFLKPATVNSMLKKLRDKGLVDYERYGKISLTEKGRFEAGLVLRKHRLWETFLYEKLDFSWDELHEIAEQLEHIKSMKLIDKLDAFLGYPNFDPHGDPIPDLNGNFDAQYFNKLNDFSPKETCVMVAVGDDSSSFLKYLDVLGLGINVKIEVISKQEFDDSVVIEVNQKRHNISQKLAENIFVICESCFAHGACLKTKACR